MAETTSIRFPNMFNVAQSKVEVITDEISVRSRSKLLLKTEPTELYNNPDFGTGLKQYMYQYNTSNTRAIVKDRILDRLQKYEPCCDIEQTNIYDGLQFTGSDSSPTQYNKLELTVEITTTFGSKLSVELNSDVDFIAFNE